jgi:hypothetical protein
MQNTSVFGRLAALLVAALMLLGLFAACTPAYVAQKEGTCNRGRVWQPPTDANKLPSGEVAAGKCEYSQ